MWMCAIILLGLGSQKSSGVKYWEWHWCWHCKGDSFGSRHNQSHACKLSCAVVNSISKKIANHGRKKRIEWDLMMTTFQRDWRNILRECFGFLVLGSYAEQLRQGSFEGQVYLFNWWVLDSVWESRLDVQLGLCLILCDVGDDCVMTSWILCDIVPLDDYQVPIEIFLLAMWWNSWCIYYR